MQFNQEIEQLTATVWEAMLQRTIEPEHDPLPAGTRTMSACVHITGAWRGAVALSCDEAMAAEAAAIMFGTGTADASLNDMQDAVAELVNMIGGNVKALLPETCHLSLPSVVQGAQYTVRVPGSRTVTQVPLKSGSHHLSVSLLESVDNAAT